MTSTDIKPFKYKDYSIPVRLVDLTGGGTETWESIAKYHQSAYAKYAPIKPSHNVLEIGCGVGRDAIELTEKLTDGKYIGIDIIKPSIEWCQQNITRRFPNFEFHYLDINSPIHNPRGKLQTTGINLPVENAWADRIILQSVFTHMFSWDIVHYLKEFKRVLKPGGKVFASFFILDDETERLIKAGKSKFSFEHKVEDGCFTNDPDYPEGAVAYTRETLDQLIKFGGLALDQPIHYGVWSGRKNTEDGQDIVILRQRSLVERAKGKLARI